MTIRIETLGTVRKIVRASIQASLAAALMVPFFLMAGVGISLLSVVTATDIMVPISSAIMAIAVALALVARGISILIQRADVQALMDFYGLTPGCMALTPEELADGSDQKTMAGVAGKS